jgi:hypothetical protein
VLWDPGWYGGTYPLNYSVVYPLLAGHLGLWVLAGISAAAAAACFDRLVLAHFGRRPFGSWYFAVSTLVEVAIGQLPMLAGEAFGLGALLALHHRRRSEGATRTALAVAGLAMGVLAALSSPVAGAFVALALVAWGLADLAGGTAKRGPRTRSGLLELSGGALALGCTAALSLVFPGAGHFPFGQGDLAVVLLISALLAAPLLRPPLALRTGAWLYGLASVALFAVRNQVGDNDARLAAYIGVPLALCFLGPGAASSLDALRGRARGGFGARPGAKGRFGPAGGWPGRRPAFAAAAATVAGGLLVAWHWSPVLESFDQAANGAASQPGFYSPLINELERLSGPGPVRVEIPPTRHHWEAAYVAPQFPLARGWERQLDLAYNPIFYTAGSLSGASYQAWLVANGVSYVALPSGVAIDYAGVGEAALLRSGDDRGLEVVWRSRTWELWRVSGSSGLASGAARVTSLGPGSVDVKFSRPSTSEVKVRWSRYWSLPASAAKGACLSRAPGGWVRLSVAKPGQVSLHISLLHADHGRCPPAAGLAPAREAAPSHGARHGAASSHDNVRSG